MLCCFTPSDRSSVRQSLPYPNRSTRKTETTLPYLTPDVDSHKSEHAAITPGRKTCVAMKTPEEEQASWFQLKVKQPAVLCYQRYFVELVLRQKPLPPSKDGRHVPLNAAHEHPLIDERRGHAFISNSIRSSRYTLLDFLPKQLLFQATRLSNFYFICIGVPQTIPGLSTTGSYTTILPLAFFILLTMAKEGYDDFCRHKLDKVENNKLALVLRQKDASSKGKVNGSVLERLLSTLPTLPKGSKSSVGNIVEETETDEDDTFAWAKTKWHNIAVGDVIKLKRDDDVPADIALLYSSGENGVAYIETMALDGETNLKPKQALPALVNACSTVSDVHGAEVECVLEDPNPNLYDFNGKVSVNGQTLPLTLNEVVYRGSVLRNTSYLYGLVINTGEECVIRMNANHHPKAKTPRLERYANQVVLTLIVYVVVLSIGVSCGYLLWHSEFEEHAWYLQNAAPAFKEIIIGFIIMFNNVIPLALYISLEIVKIGQLLMVQSDVKMFDEASNTPMTCNTNTILENLGQVSYILSDKTGTLTENVMRFRGISLGGIVWMHEPASLDSPAPEAGLNEKSHLKVTTQTKSEAVRPSFDNPSIVVEEREVPSSKSSNRSSEPRASQVFTRRSLSRPRQAQAERTTAELLQIMQRQPGSAVARKAREFILGLAICHTALPEVDENGTMDFQASSPDELALVRAAQDLGFLLVHRSSQKIQIRITPLNGSEMHESYEILEVIEFSSKRKRMSIVVRCPDNRVWLICKGADSSIIPRLRQAELAERQSHEVRRSSDYGRRLARKSEQNEPRNSFGARPSLQIRGRSSMDVRRSIGIGRATLDVPKPSFEVRKSLQQDLISFEDVEDSALFGRTFTHIDAFASEGLRTLLFAHKYLEADEYDTWKKIHHEATTSLVHRQERIYAAGEMIEQGFDLLGASAIEDKLQKGVPETIEKLRKANIKIWMLTGDKRETAINIAHSARICQPTSVVSILDSTKGDLAGQMADVLQDDQVHRMVVVDGQTLTIVSANPELKHTFFSTIISQIDSVIVCRASPAQKASIVTAIRARLSGLTLAIGDGANDIAMIQAAHVGVGLSGKEGLQAARVADFSIAQFRFLQRLLLVHGRYQYVRTAKFVLLTFWKEMFFYMMQALYQRHNGYTGTSLYESWSLTVLNTL